MQAPFSRTDIWLVLSQVPEGKVVTYGQLARMAGAPGYARVVGNILKQLPKGSGLPWHRVINGKGRISFPEDSVKYNEQKELLEQEGVIFISGKVSLSHYAWNGE
ncbi:MGMT family protein [Endozoicomonas montiporae]|uniref:Putative methylated-DNA--protein-cysteine methyltransferase n=1 Tax=Endozoicomonas montiporae CL-33 TaxID=570277 RepID=A0A142B8Y5_9GAMM|nr:MGMT family protein [Endozoicomonas montiporae]AMO55211.1 putative methylated-DNA--protein-cysteine methyltransferase [Endozoicomonas montiporae CL-33]